MMYRGMLPNADPSEANATYSRNRLWSSYTYLATTKSTGMPNRALSANAMTKGPQIPSTLSSPRIQAE